MRYAPAPQKAWNTVLCSYSWCGKDSKQIITDLTGLAFLSPFSHIRDFEFDSRTICVFDIFWIYLYLDLPNGAVITSHARLNWKALTDIVRSYIYHWNRELAISTDKWLYPQHMSIGNSTKSLYLNFALHMLTAVSRVTRRASPSATMSSVLIWLLSTEGLENSDTYHEPPPAPSHCSF